jgi:hypothetical protein
MENVAESPAKRLAPYQFKPGNPGGPGRPAKSPATRNMERMTRAQAQAALEGLVGPALKVLHRALKSKDEALALRAAVDVFDRTQGKALQRVEGTITNETVIQATPEMLKLAAQRLLAASATDVEVK